MAKYLKLGAFIAVILAVQSAQATDLRDPTLPPAQIGLSTTDDAVSAMPVLQSVVLGSQIKSAMISGQTVLLGKKYQDYVLVKLSANEATLRDVDGKLMVLKMDYLAIKKPLVKSHAIN